MIKSQPVNPERDKIVYKLHKEGVPYRKISERLGISSTRAFNIVCRIEYEALDKKVQQPRESSSYWNAEQR